MGENYISIIHKDSGVVYLHGWNCSGILPINFRWRYHFPDNNIVTEFCLFVKIQRMAHVDMQHKI
jgi:hypothetical protein